MSRFFAAGRRTFTRRPILSSSLALAPALGVYSYLASPDRSHADIDAQALYFNSALRMEGAQVEGTLDRPSTMWTPPSREEMLQKLGCPAHGRDPAQKVSQSGTDDAVAEQESQSRRGQRAGQQDSGSTKSTNEPPSVQPGQTSGSAAGKGDADKQEDEFDLLIVGGGATGAGVALDAASRGLRVAMVERDDFSSGAFRSHAVLDRLLISLRMCPS